MVEAVGPEADVARFVEFAVRGEEEEDTCFTEQFETGLLHRERGRAKVEVMSRWEPPLEVFANVSEQFPMLTFGIEWEEPGTGLIGCANFASGNGKVFELDNVVRLARDTLRERFRERHGDDWEQNDGLEEAVSELHSEITQQIVTEASRLLRGGNLQERQRLDKRHRWQKEGF
jgi:hypothetical protein